MSNKKNNNKNKNNKDEKSSKCFHLVLNPKTLEHYTDVLEYLTGLSGVIYILITEHIGPDVHNFTKHYHIYIQFTNSRRLSPKKLYGAHFDICYGSAQENINYLTCKDEKHIKLGTQYKLIYEQGKPKLKGGIPSIKDLKNIENEDDLTDYRSYHTWKILNDKKKKRYSVKNNNTSKNVQVFYIQGPTGSGKTEFKAMEIIEKYEADPNYTDFHSEIYKIGEFWHNVDEESDICLYDEFRDHQMKAEDFIRFTNYRKTTFNVKGGNEDNNYKIIVITSKQDLDEIYTDYICKKGFETRKQWNRRINLIDCYPPNEKYSKEYIKKQKFKSYTNIYEECKKYLIEKNYEFPEEYEIYENSIKNNKRKEPIKEDNLTIINNINNIINDNPRQDNYIYEEQLPGYEEYQSTINNPTKKRKINQE